MNTPSYLEDHISQVPALQLLLKMGYEYLSPSEVLLERRGRLSGVLLEKTLGEQLRRLNRIRYKGQEYFFSESNIQGAVQALKDIPYDGLVRTSEKVYDLLSLGKSFEQTIGGDKKSFTLKYVDWNTPTNNVFQVIEEFEVETTVGDRNIRPDLVLFVNGIPFGIIECKRPDIKEPLVEAISQHIRNQDSEYIPKLFTFAQILLAVTKNEASYATTGTPRKFWAIWREDGVDKNIGKLLNKPLIKNQNEKLFKGRFSYVRQYFDTLDSEGRQVTPQDRAIYSLCRPERLLELAHKFIVYDAGEKKIARYQQYFAVRDSLERIKQFDENGPRKGGVIWHTQGSGKSLTMVMLGKAIALEPGLVNPKIVLVTDRVDLDDQIYNTFRSCGKEPVRARTGVNLFEYLSENRESIITTTIFKFDTVVAAKGYRNESPDIFVMVDESHRSNYKEFHQQMRKVLPRACYIGFTGTPLVKKEKSTLRQFGGFIGTPYTIRRAVEDKAVVPLLYEGRHILQDVDQQSIDKWFELITKPLTPAQRLDLKKKFASANQLNKADQRLHMLAYDIGEHFVQNWKGTFAKGQIACGGKEAALKIKQFLDEFGHVTSEVLISGPDDREGNDSVETVKSEPVQAFWTRMMERFGTEAEYNKQIINAFKKAEDPELIIVVDKLLTGFDAPRNTILYLDKKLRDHSLLQAIARVNRLQEGKEFGFVLDYYGVLQQLGDALQLYDSLADFDEADIEDALTDISAEVAKLPQKHSELWDIFKTVRNRLDEEAFESHLQLDNVREEFYGKFSSYNRTLGIALSATSFYQKTPEEQIARYKQDLLFFQKLRASVKKRYSDSIDYKEYEKKVQKLVDVHVDSTEVVEITPWVNIFEQEKFQHELEKLETTASKADTIASRTKRTITEKMEEDPFFYRRFSRILQDVIDDYREQRLTDAEYLAEVTKIMNSVVYRTGDNTPAILNGHSVAKAFYGIVNEVIGGADSSTAEQRQTAAEAALRIDAIVLRNRVVDWTENIDIQNQISNEIDDYLYELRENSGVKLTLEDMDKIVENAVSVAKVRYA
jgi:type I restriction enzyme R subunit